MARARDCGVDNGCHAVVFSCWQEVMPPLVVILLTVCHTTLYMFSWIKRDGSSGMSDLNVCAF
jgi:hypothetical protein